MRVDAIIFGGGAAGLWTLDELTNRGCSALLLEAGDLGSGQTIASQGIIHGGMKYALRGRMTESARNVREMPEVWRACLAGRRTPNLSRTRIRANSCHLWRTDSLASRVGMLGARFGLSIAPRTLTGDERPDVLRRCPGRVAGLDEQIISPRSFIEDLFGCHRERILRIDAEQGIEIDQDGFGEVRSLALVDPASGARIRFQPRHVILTAGAGNGALRRRLGLSEPVMQRRPLHMVLARGRLPELNGHCVDGSRTRVTITSDRDDAGRTVWQIGGQIAEEGVPLDESALIVRARDELREVIPGLSLAGIEWSTYRVDRAEGKTSGGKRPETVQRLRDANVLTAWPTKLALAPRLAEELARQVGTQSPKAVLETESFADWPRPCAARPPWETATRWAMPEPAQAARPEERAA